MGHKVPPLANRLGFTRTWNSRWFSKKQAFGLLLNEDDKIRQFLHKNLGNAAVNRVEIERTASRVRVIIHSARPGIVIGRRGADIDRLREDLHAMTHREIAIDIKEVKNPAVEAQLVAENIAFQLERQVSFRRAMKRAVQLAMTAGGLGIKVRCGGRLGGAEMSRVESYKDGKVPLGTFRANIDYGFAEAKTTYGRIGVKCWIYKGDSLLSKTSGPAPEAAAAAPQPSGAAGS
ncbi:MAG: 30S ribosomal protein S3 [Candidatus Omnitrophica bacterium]|nr:30S ribosomal protein S3 [Candidatus Omnitrophota bacterium]